MKNIEGVLRAAFPSHTPEEYAKLLNSSAEIYKKAVEETEKIVKISIKDYRCPTCGKLLFRAHIPRLPGLRIEIRCKCARMVIVESEENMLVYCDGGPLNGQTINIDSGMTLFNYSNLVESQNGKYEIRSTYIKTDQIKDGLPIFFSNPDNDR